MPITLDDLRKKRVKLELTLDGEPLTVEYLPEKMTLRVRSNLRVGLGAYAPKRGGVDGVDAGVDAVDALAAAEAEVDEAYKAYCAELATVLVAWDVVDGGKPYAPTGENLAALHPDIVVAIGREVAKDSFANPRIAATSKSTSQATE